MSDNTGHRTDERAQRAFESVVRANRSIDAAVDGSGYTSESASNAALGQNILREEIGYFGEYGGPHYEFDQRTRDVLLAHGRQDTASAFAMAQSAFREAHRARRSINRISLYLLLSLLLNVAILAKLWWG